MTFNEKIDIFMKEHNIDNIKQLAIASDIPYTTLNDFYNKQSADNSRLSTIRKLSKYMGCTMDYLSFDEIIDFNGHLNFDNGTLIDIQEDTIKIPVLGVIKAGTPIEAQQDIIEYVNIPKEWLKIGKEYFGLKISGNSMSPKYLPNDTVIFEHTSDIDYVNNKDCCVLVNGFDATFKKVNLNPSGITLTPLNLENDDGYLPTFYDTEQIQKLPITIMGVATKKISNID